MPSLLLYLDKAWEMTVLPQPKAPGIAQVPEAEYSQTPLKLLKSGTENLLSADISHRAANLPNNRILSESSALN